ncbi:MAG: hypothetical protein ACOCYZ_04500 [Halococcoides sp.]
MRVRQQQLKYGAVFGLATFFVGWAITYVLTPPDLLIDTSRWKVTLWVFLSAHFVSISGLQLGGLSSAFSQVDLIAQEPMLRGLRAVPILLTALGGVMMVEAVNYTTRFKYLIQNSGALLTGYLSAGLLAVVVSGAQPSVAVIIVLAVLLAGGTYIGSTVTNRLTTGLPVFAVTSLGGVVLIGLLVVLGGLVVLQSIAPLIGVSLVGVTIGAVVAWTARNVPS